MQPVLEGGSIDNPLTFDVGLSVHLIQCNASFQSNCAEGLHFSAFHYYCSCPVCMYVCVYVCMCVHSYLPPHTLESQKRDTNGFCTIQGSFKILPIFLKMLRSKVMA